MIRLLGAYMCIAKIQSKGAGYDWFPPFHKENSLLRLAVYFPAHKATAEKGVPIKGKNLLLLEILFRRETNSYESVTFS